MQMIYVLLIIYSISFAQERKIARDEVFLTPTYGILSEKDRAYGHRGMSKTYGSSFKDNAATAWQCFESKKIKIDCMAIQHSESEGCYPRVVVHNKKRVDLYFYRKGFGKTYCKDQMSILRRILRADKVCIAGDYVAEKIKNDEEYWQWQFARIKSAKGDYCNWAEDEWGCFSSW
jgi:hypothetical protein